MAIPSSAFRILTIDGGGTLGVLPSTALEEMEFDLQKDNPEAQLRDFFDLVAGTSTGGMLAMCIAAGIPMSEAKNIYLKRSGEIFSDSLWDNIRDLGSTLGAQYDNKHLKKLLSEDELFGTKTLGDIANWRSSAGKGIHVMIPTFDLSPEIGGKKVDYRPRIFQSFFERDKDETLVDVALRTTAAPTYFPVFQQKYVDGGVAMNNPSMAALAFAANRQESTKGVYGGASKKKQGLGEKLKDIHLFSIGTGTANQLNVSPDEVGDGDWGGLKWLNYIPSMITATNLHAADYYTKNMLDDDHYHRLEFDFSELAKEKSIEMDITDQKTLQKLSVLAKEQFDAVKEDVYGVLKFGS